MFDILMSKPAPAPQDATTSAHELIMPYVKQLEERFQDSYAQEKDRADRSEARVKQLVTELETTRLENRRLEERAYAVVNNPIVPGPSATRVRARARKTFHAHHLLLTIFQVRQSTAYRRMMENYEADVTASFGAVENALAQHAGELPRALRDALGSLLSAGTSAMETDGNLELREESFL